MIYFFIISIIYTGLLILVKPSLNSLKAAPISFIQNLKNIKVSLTFGLFLLFIFLFTSKFTFISTDKEILKFLALNNGGELSMLWIVQLITHLFIHADIIHILANIAFLGLASLYERRIGSKRFIVVLFVSSIFSIPSVFFYQEPIVVCGISGGIFGLAAGYFTDFENLTIKEWISAILIFVFLFFLISIESDFKLKIGNNLNFQIDHVGHIMGAIGGIIFCRLNPFVGRKE